MVPSLSQNFLAVAIGICCFVRRVVLCAAGALQSGSEGRLRGARWSWPARNRFREGQVLGLAHWQMLLDLPEKVCARVQGGYMVVYVV